MQRDTDHVAAAHAVAGAVASFEGLDDLRAVWLASRRRSACRSGAPVDQAAAARTDTALTGSTFVYLVLARVQPALALAWHVDDASECVAGFCKRMVTEGRIGSTSDIGDAAVLAVALGAAPGPATALQAVADLLMLALVVDCESTAARRPVIAGVALHRAALPLFVVPSAADRDDVPVLVLQWQASRGGASGFATRAGSRRCAAPHCWRGWRPGAAA